MRNAAIGETQGRRLVLEAGRLVADALPATWTVTVEDGQGPVDGFLSIEAPDGTAVRVLVEAKPGHLTGGAAVIAQTLTWAREAGLPPLLVTPYAGSTLRRMCDESGVNYLDLTGWSSIRLDSPAVLLRTTGAERDPRPPRPATITRLNGVGAARIIRTVLDVREPVGIRALAARADVAPGTVSKVLKALDAEAAVERDGNGRLVTVRKRGLVERWTRDYRFLRSNEVGWYLAPRGVRQVLDRAEADGVPFVGTGSIALRRYLPDERVPVTPLSQLAAYVPDLAAVSRILGLTPADRSTANVILAVPYDAQLLTTGQGAGDVLAVVDVGQAVADLLTLPGRGPEEADQFMDYLAEDDASWH